MIPPMTTQYNVWIVSRIVIKGTSCFDSRNDRIGIFFGADFRFATGFLRVFALVIIGVYTGIALMAIVVFFCYNLGDARQKTNKIYQKTYARQAGKIPRATVRNRQHVLPEASCYIPDRYVLVEICDAFRVAGRDTDCATTRLDYWSTGGSSFRASPGRPQDLVRSVAVCDRCELFWPSRYYCLSDCLSTFSTSSSRLSPDAASVSAPLPTYLRCHGSYATPVFFSLSSG